LRRGFPHRMILSRWEVEMEWRCQRKLMQILNNFILHKSVQSPIQCNTESFPNKPTTIN
jgi:hypothetical protein